jgi:uncharacterized iron-regulated membrane protein
MTYGLPNDLWALAVGLSLFSGTILGLLAIVGFLLWWDRTTTRRVTNERHARKSWFS